MIRLGVVGYGSRISGMVSGPFRSVEPDLRVVGVVDPDEAGVRQRLAEVDREDVVFYESLESMVRKAAPDALAIGTRCNLHQPTRSRRRPSICPLSWRNPWLSPRGRPPCLAARVSAEKGRFATVRQLRSSRTQTPTSGG